jgi:hypothetical protein
LTLAKAVYGVAVAILRRVFTVIAAVALLAVAGCGEVDVGADPAPSTSGLDTLRTDPDPIAKRFPGLGEFTAVHWIAWYRTDPRVPGPNAYDLQALVVLSPADAAAAAAAYAWESAPADADATMREELRPYAPAQPEWRHSQQYAQDIRAEGYAAQVYVDLASGTVYLQTLLE